MRYLERFLAKVAGEKISQTPTPRTDKNDENTSGTIEFFGNAHTTNRQKRQKPISSFLSVPHVGVSEKITPPAIAPAVPLTSERDRLVAAYRSQLEAIGNLSGAELRAATERLLSLAKRIDRLSRPGRFDWKGLWVEVGVSQIDTPRAEEVATWTGKTKASAAWLASLDPRTFKPFTLPTGREIRKPAAYIAALRREVAKGPNGPHAAQVERDLEAVAIALASITTESSPEGRQGEGFSVEALAFIPDTLPTEPPATFLARFGAAAIAEAFGVERTGELVAIAERFEKASAWDKPTIRAKFWAAWLKAARSVIGGDRLGHENLKKPETPAASSSPGNTEWLKSAQDAGSEQKCPGETLTKPNIFPTPSSPAPAREWDADTARRLAWLETIEPPAQPFRLDVARMVSDPALFVARLRADAARGPDGPRARNGALQSDLAQFEALMTEGTVKR